MITDARFAKRMATLKVPAGFTMEIITEPKWGNTGGWLIYELRSETVKIQFHQTGDGSTLYLHEGKWYTFDQRGVCASFQHLPGWSGDKHRYDLNAIVKAELRRVQERLEFYKTAVYLPGTAFMVQPKELEEMKKKLTSGKPVSFMPSGFGAGFVFTMYRSRLNRPATKAQLEFFGVSQLYVETLDCD